MKENPYSPITGVGALFIDVFAILAVTMVVAYANLLTRLPAMVEVEITARGEAQTPDSQPILTTLTVTAAGLRLSEDSPPASLEHLSEELRALADQDGLILICAHSLPTEHLWPILAGVEEEVGRPVSFIPCKPKDTAP